MPPAEFASLLEAIGQTAMADEKLALVRETARGQWFTVDQVIRILEQLPFSDGKVEAGVLLYPHVVDRNGWFRVYAAIPHASDREQLRQRVGQLP